MYSGQWAALQTYFKLMDLYHWNVSSPVVFSYTSAGMEQTESKIWPEVGILQWNMTEGAVS